MGHAETLAMLRDGGANLNTPWLCAMFPAFIAAQRDYADVLAVLRDGGANLDMPNKVMAE